MRFPLLKSLIDMLTGSHDLRDNLLCRVLLFSKQILHVLRFVAKLRNTFVTLQLEHVILPAAFNFTSVS